MKRKLIAMLLALSMVSLVACGSNDSTEQKEPSTEQEQEVVDDTNETDKNTKEKLALFENACYVNEMLDFCIIKDSCVTLNENTVTFYGNCEREIGKLQEIYVKNDDKK